LVDPSGSVEQIAESLREHVSSQAEVFASDYQGYLPIPIKTEGSPEVVLSSLLRAVRKTSYRLYLLIDDYDIPVNEAMARGIKAHPSLVRLNEPFRRLFSSVKSAMEGQGLERVFITGVSPGALTDLRSGFDIAKDVSLEPEVAGLCGFQEGEIRSISQERGLTPEAVEDAVEMMRTWYNGYRFTDAPCEGLYNPSDVLYLLDHLDRCGVIPRHDESLRRKVTCLARTPAGAGVIEKVKADGEIAIPQLETSFSLDTLLSRLGEDRGLVTSLLYFIGLLTLTDIPGRLRVPNLVVQKLLFDDYRGAGAGSPL